jgi:hypothetical protein
MLYKNCDCGNPLVQDEELEWGVCWECHWHEKTECKDHKRTEECVICNGR